jgi:hypothetical protein
VSQQSAEIAGPARSAFTQDRTQLRRDADDGSSGDGVSGVRELWEERAPTSPRFPDADRGERGRTLIADELYAWLACASLDGERRRAEGSAGLAAVRARDAAPEPTGDDSFGVGSSARFDPHGSERATPAPPRFDGRPRPLRSREPRVAP